MTEKELQITWKYKLLFLIMLLLLSLFIYSATNPDWERPLKKLNCERKILFENNEIYCKEVPILKTRFLIENQITSYEISNKTKERIDEENRKIQAEEKVKQEEERRKIQTKEIEKRNICIKNGREINITFDIIKDYGLNCNKLAYINDHLIDNYIQKNGGYISGESHQSGLFSYGYGKISGEFYTYVNERILATGQLVRNIYRQTDCNGEIIKKSCIVGESNMWYGNTYVGGYSYTGDKCSTIYEELLSRITGYPVIEDTTTEIITYYSKEDFVMYYVNNCISEEVKQ